MSPVIPFDILSLIIDIVWEKEDKNLLKELKSSSDVVKYIRKVTYAVSGY